MTEQQSYPHWSPQQPQSSYPDVPRPHPTASPTPVSITRLLESAALRTSTPSRIVDPTPSTIDGEFPAKGAAGPHGGPGRGPCPGGPRGGGGGGGCSDHAGTAAVANGEANAAPELVPAAADCWPLKRANSACALVAFAAGFVAFPAGRFLGGSLSAISGSLIG
jgi:hypothetical protein